MWSRRSQACLREVATRLGSAFMDMPAKWNRPAHTLQLPQQHSHACMNIHKVSPARPRQQDWVHFKPLKLTASSPRCPGAHLVDWKGSLVLSGVAHRNLLSRQAPMYNPLLVHVAQGFSDLLGSSCQAQDHGGQVLSRGGILQQEFARSHSVLQGGREGSGRRSVAYCRWLTARCLCCRQGPAPTRVPAGQLAPGKRTSSKEV